MAILDLLSIKLSVKNNNSPFIIAILCLTIFCLAFTVRLLHWQDKHIEIVNSWRGLGYDEEAKRILNGGGILFFRDEPKNGDIRGIIHPPAYSLLMAITLKFFRDPDSALAIIQALLDALSPVIIFLLCLRLFPLTVSLITALMATFSPHFAYYSLIRSPDSLAVLMILIAAYLFIRTTENYQKRYPLLSGIFIGLSCWFRPNALFLAPFLAIIFYLFIKQRNSLLVSVLLIGGTLLTIAPITIRNLIIYQRFVPISVGAGANIIEGIADYDFENRFKLPQYDPDVAKTDAKWFNRPEYANNQWTPDGFLREQERVKRAKEVIFYNPIWFTKVMIKRASFMLTYNGGKDSRWPFNTSLAPIVAAEAAYSSDLTTLVAPQIIVKEKGLEKFFSPLIKDNRIAFEDDHLSFTGDASAFNDQFGSIDISVEQNSDYLIKLNLKLVSGNAAIKVINNRTVLTSTIVNNEATEAIIYFAAGNRDKVQLIISNNGSANPVLQLSKIEIYKQGETAFTNTRWIRIAIRGIQKNLYLTSYLVPLIIVGIILLFLADRRRDLILLLAIPAYYLSFQSLLHTEYRYVLVIHYFLFIFVAIAIYGGCNIAINKLLGRKLS